jgi:hypothetical protein
MLVFRVMIWLIRGVILPRKILLAENLALHQQVLVYQRRIKRPKLYSSDRHFWVWLSQEGLEIVSIHCSARDGD